MLDTQQAMASEQSLLIPALGRFYARSGILAYVLLRVAFGLTIVTHGIPKLTGGAHGSMADPLQGSTHLIANVLHLPFAPELAMFVALLETFGGLAVALGFATRIFALLLSIQMVFICIALGPTYPWIDRGIEYPIMLGFVALLIAARGAVACAIDHRIGREL